MLFVLLLACVVFFAVGAFLWVKNYSLASYICLSIGLTFLVYLLVKHFSSSSSSSSLPNHHSSSISSSSSSTSSLHASSPFGKVSYPIVSYPLLSSSTNSKDNSSSSSTPAGPFLDDVGDVVHQLVQSTVHSNKDDHQVIQQAILVSDAIATVSTVNGHPDDSIFSQKTLRSIGNAINQLTLYFAPGQRAPISSEDVVQALDDTRQVVLRNKPPRSFYKTAASIIAVGSVAYLASRSEPVSSFVQTVFDTWVQGLASMNEYGKNEKTSSSSTFFSSSFSSSSTSSSSSSSSSNLSTSTAYSFARNVWRLLEMSRAEMKLFWNMHLTTLRDLLPHPVQFMIPVAHTVASSSSSSYPVSLMQGPLDLLQNPIRGGMKALGKVRRTVKQWMVNLVQPGRVIGEGSSSTLTSHDELLEMVVGTFVILMVFGTVLYDYFGGNSSSVQQQFGRKKSRKVRGGKK